MIMKYISSIILKRMEKNLLIKPFLKWAGGKRQLAPEIISRSPIEYGRYFEPFVGAGAILFTLLPKAATINDLNEQLCLTYKVVRDDVESLIELLDVHKANNSEEYYYKERERGGGIGTAREVDIAARLIYLNKTCFNGLFRVNSSGNFNTPYGRYKNPAIFDKNVLRAISRYLSENDIKIQSGDFTDAVSGATKEDFVYFDPPYDSPNSANFTSYQAFGFSRNDQIRLRNTMLDLTNLGVKCLLSNSSTDFINNLYSCPEFKIDYVEASRMINSNAAGRGKIQEILVRNW